MYLNQPVPSERSPTPLRDTLRLWLRKQRLRRSPRRRRRCGRGDVASRGVRIIGPQSSPVAQGIPLHARRRDPRLTAAKSHRASEGRVLVGRGPAVGRPSIRSFGAARDRWCERTIGERVEAANHDSRG